MGWVGAPAGGGIAPARGVCAGAGGGTAAEILLAALFQEGSHGAGAGLSSPG